MSKKKKSTRRRTKLSKAWLLGIIFGAVLASVITIAVLWHASSSSTSSATGEGGISGGSAEKLVKGSASIFCDQVEIKGDTYYLHGNCTAIISIFNNASTAVVVYGLRMPGAGISVVVNETVQPNSSILITRSFTIPSRVQVEQLQVAYLATSHGIFTVNVNINI